MEAALGGPGIPGILQCRPVDFGLHGSRRQIGYQCVLDNRLRRERTMQMNDMKSWVHKARVADDQRADVPGEHWAVMGAGLVMLLLAARGRSFIGRTVAGAVGSALLGRAATGRGGLHRVVRAFNGVRR
jgi:hypothetical protein